MKAQAILDGIADELNDNANTRWSVATLLGYINQAQRQLVLVRPDASSSSSGVRLVVGTKQNAPAGALRVLDVVRNLGEDGATPGHVITRANREDIDLYDRRWHAASGKSAVKHFTLDDRTPLVYYVYPAVTAAKPVYVELVTSVAPTAVDDGQDDLSVSEVYQGPLQDWVLYLCFSTNTESPNDYARARGHQTSFYNALGIKTRSDVAMSPNQPQGGTQ